jgi:hypothetical protein
MNLCRILLALIRDMGRCPCPRCMVIISEIPNLGSKIDMAKRGASSRGSPSLSADVTRKVEKARQQIYSKRKGVKSTAVEALLKEKSYVPTVVSTTSCFNSCCGAKLKSRTYS